MICDASYSGISPTISNPAQTNRNYAHGHDPWLWAMEPEQYD
jgi:hypothetical protein